MNYSEILHYLFNRLPMFQRVGGAAYKANLDNTHKMCALLGHPEKEFKTVHIAGTNGKGSTSNLLASVFQECGYKTGLYTSPHYIDFRERIRVNGKMISEDWVVDFIAKWQNDLETIDLSFFEMTVGMAFQYFADQNVDIAVIEVGLGGRLDSTNVISPQASVITNIGLDHTRFLGNTLPKIALEKAGIIKQNIPVIIGETQAEVKLVFDKKAISSNAPISYADQGWQIVKLEDDSSIKIFYDGQLFLEVIYPLRGTYQNKNLKTVLETIRVLQQSGEAIPKGAIKKGIENIFANTGFQGRWQVLGNAPLVICDSGHNHEGIVEVVKNINIIKYKNLHFVFGVVNDKSLDEILDLLPTEAVYYFCKADIPRGLHASELAEKAASYQLKGNIFPSVKKAYEAAKQKAGPEDLIFVGGSTFVVAEVLGLSGC